MKIRIVLAALTALLGVTGPAHAVNMFAGPLYATLDDGCGCELVNITTAAKSVRVQIIAQDGQILGDSGTVSLGAGKAMTLSRRFPGAQYCKFTNAAPAYFRGTITCYGTPNDSDNVAVPAQ